MEVKEFFEKTKKICEKYDGRPCGECPLDDYCMEWLFALEPENVKRLIKIVEKEVKNDVE